MSALDNYDNPKVGETWLVKVDGTQGRTEIVEVVRELNNNASYLVLRTIVATVYASDFIKEVD